jgi:glycosyltransferase involved in cell wall biosynthesis
VAEKNKVVHIITRLDKGGSAENTVLTVSLLDKEKYEVFLARGQSLESSMTPPEKETAKRDLSQAEVRGVKIFTITSLVRRLSPVNDLRAFISIYQLLKRIKPRVVHTHTSKAGILGRWAAYLARVPIIIHTPHGHVFYGYFNRVLAGVFILMEKYTSFITHKIVTLTDKEQEEHLQFKIAPKDRFMTIHSGVALEKYSPSIIHRDHIKDLKAQLGLLEDDPIVGTVGRLTPVKGHEYLIKAAGKILNNFPETRFLLIGAGELRGYLEELCGELGVSRNVLFLGWRDDIPALLSLTDIFVLPSLNEGMGRVLVEAMALSKPIVAFRVGGVPNLIQNSENGILIPPRDIDGLAQAITTLLADRDLMEKMGANGKEKVPSYSAENMTRKIEILYETLLQ